MYGLFNKVCTSNEFGVEKGFKKSKFYFCLVKKYNEWLIYHDCTLFHFQIFSNHFTSSINIKSLINLDILFSSNLFQIYSHVPHDIL
jgi:hypothetical protein